MGRVSYDYMKSSIVRVSPNKDLFIQEVIKASKTLLPYQKENLINWLYFFTADKPELQKWLGEFLDKNTLVR
ncbi:hypothetical protein [Flavobacterium sp.]|uniref:hypothetical protein n=1 Tax=Flavobacterium sp. TaxID=239 RepID=UPI002FDA86C4